MRVVNLMLGAGRGGLEQAAVDFGEALRVAGVETLSVTLPGAWANDGLDAAGLPRRDLALGLLDLAGPWRLRDLVRPFRPTHILCHGNRALKLASHPAVRGAVPGARVVAVTHNYSLKHIGGADHVLALTRDLARACREAGVGAGRLHRIGNLVRVPPQLPAARARWQDPPVIGALGRFVPKKGFEVLVEALARLSVRGVAFAAAIGGDGPEDTALRQLARLRGLGDRLRFPGWIADRQAFLDGIDIAVVPSHHEPFGIVVLEAMAQGLPVVATASEGPSEILADGTGGQLVPRADPGALADALEALLADPDAARARGAAAHAEALRRWDLPASAQRLVAALGAMA